MVTSPVGTVCSAASNNRVSRSQFHGATSGSTKSGNQLITTIDVSFREGFAGEQHMYLFTGDVDGHVSGWQQVGTWTPQPDEHLTEVTSLTPTGAYGAAQTFTATFTEGDGADDIWFTQISINAGLNAYNGCYIHHDPANNVFYLLNDTATEWYGMFGGSGQVENSQCRLIGAGSGRSKVGNQLTVTYQLEFKPGFSGLKDMYVQGSDLEGQFFPWRKIGNWTVP